MDLLNINLCVIIIGYYTVLCTIWKDTVYRFSIQYGRVQYISILYITLYNDLQVPCIYYTAEMINTITTILCLTFNSVNRTTAQQYFVRKMFCINTDLVISKMNLKTAK
jgi:hypothetical protein